VEVWRRGWECGEKSYDMESLRIFRAELLLHHRISVYEVL